MNDLEKQRQLEALLREYDIITKEIQIRLSTNERVMTLGLTILGVGVTLAIKEKVNEILLFMPLGVFSVLFYALQNNMAMTAIGGYRFYLQEKINGLIGEEILIWERVSQQLIHRNIPVFPLNMIYALILGLSVFISLRSAWHSFSIKTFLAAAFVFGVLFVLLAVSVRKSFKSFTKAFELANTSNTRIVTGKSCE